VMLTLKCFLAFSCKHRQSDILW